MLIKSIKALFLSKKWGYKKVLLNWFFLNNITQWNCIQTQIFIPVILFLAEKRWLDKGIMEMKV